MTSGALTLTMQATSYPDKNDKAKSLFRSITRKKASNLSDLQVYVSNSYASPNIKKNDKSFSFVNEKNQ
jgi:hypothetical protein